MKEKTALTVVAIDDIKKNIGSFREELDDHKLAINENTVELQSCFEYLMALDKKLDVLFDRLNEPNVVKGEHSGKLFNFQTLNDSEKKIFSALYNLTQVNAFTTYQAISGLTLFSEYAIANHITRIVEKVIPVIKKYHKGVVLLSLNNKFRELQAKQNIVKVDSLLNTWLN